MNYTYELYKPQTEGTIMEQIKSLPPLLMELNLNLYYILHFLLHLMCPTMTNVLRQSGITGRPAIQSRGIACMYKSE